jgi:hypothetical protein
MPFRSRPGQPRDLLAQIHDELRERVEEAVDHVALELLVETRKAAGRPHPVADSARDRAEFEAGARMFLEHLHAHLAVADPGGSPEPEAGERAGGEAEDAIARLLRIQVALAKTRPDYWQRFDELRLAYLAEQIASGGERRGLLRRVFGR